MRPGGRELTMGWPRPGKVVIALMAANVGLYVVELILLRAGFPIDAFALSASGVFERLEIWQVVTYWWLHDPQQPWHLILNMVWLWMFGAPLERWWGGKRFLWAYVVCGLGGSILTLIFGLLSRTEALAPLLGDFWTRPHMGASGAIMGLTIAWGVVFANQSMNLVLLPQMKGKTFIIIMVAIELLTALSFNSTSSTSHFGGMAAGFLLTTGLWRPAKLKEMFRKLSLKLKQRRIEDELRRMREKDQPPKHNVRGPKDWN